jgi:hypothetical protein
VLDFRYSGNTLYEDPRVIIKGFEYGLTYMLSANTIFVLSNNNLIGEIPPSIGSLSDLGLLNLYRNQLEGKIPSSLSEISTLEELDLSRNNLSGVIHQEFSILTKLEYLDISWNRLCGRIPKGTQFDAFSENSFEGNKCLCGYPLQLCKETQNNNIVEGSRGRGWLSHVNEHVSLVALGLGFDIGLGGVVSIMILWDNARHWVMPPKTQPFYGMYRFPK